MQITATEAKKRFDSICALANPSGHRHHLQQPRGGAPM